MSAWDEQNKGLALEHLMFHAAVGVKVDPGPKAMSVIADPPNDEDRSVERRFFIKVNELNTSETGVVRGIKRSTYQVLLQKVEQPTKGE